MESDVMYVRKMCVRAVLDEQRTKGKALFSSSCLRRLSLAIRDQQEQWQRRTEIHNRDRQPRSRIILSDTGNCQHHTPDSELLLRGEGATTRERG